MSSSDFRQITIKGEAGKGERLFRAAVSAFCSLTRPSRRDQAQLEDLTLPLFDQVSVEARRFVAAALSDSPYAPATLVRRLANETVDIAAPLLIRSIELNDLDLLSLIARHGAPHARAIGRRSNLNPAIAHLVAAINRKADAEKAAAVRPGRNTPDSPVSTADSIESTLDIGRSVGEAAENARRRLRSVMLPDEGDTQRASVAAGRPTYDRLRDTVLSGNPALFQTALADSLELAFATAREIASPSSHSWLLTALRALDLSGEQAFLIAAAFQPKQFPQPEAIRLFLSCYHEMTRETALERLAVWKARTPGENTAWRLTAARSVQSGDNAISATQAK